MRVEWSQGDRMSIRFFAVKIRQCASGCAPGWWRCLPCRPTEPVLAGRPTPVRATEPPAASKTPATRHGKPSAPATRRVAGPQLLQQPHRAEAVAVAKLRHGVFAHDEFSAASAHIQNQHGRRSASFGLLVTPRKTQSASLSPEMTSISRPQLWRMASTKSSALWASRAALVAMSRSDGAPSSVAVLANIRSPLPPSRQWPRFCNLRVA